MTTERRSDAPGRRQTDLVRFHDDCCPDPRCADRRQALRDLEAQYAAVES